jgi:hypothetical protein
MDVMSRLATMARFAEPDDEKIITHCTHCGGELYEGDEAVVYDSEEYCSTDCVLSSLDVFTITVGEEN